MLFLNKNNLLLKIKEIKKEFKSISWPNRKEITQTILMVVVLILLTTFFLLLIDSLLIYLISKLI